MPSNQTKSLRNDLNFWGHLIYLYNFVGYLPKQSPLCLRTTCLELFYAERFGSHVGCMFIFKFTKYLFLKRKPRSDKILRNTYQCLTDPLDSYMVP